MPKTTKHLAKHQFKKGEPSGNPLGGKLHDPEVRAIKNLTEKELVEVGSLLVKSSIDDLKKLQKDPKSSVLQLMAASVAIRTITKGEPQAFDALLNRLVGKPKDIVEFNSTNLNANLNANAGPVDAAKLKAAILKIRSDV